MPNEKLLLCLGCICDPASGLCLGATVRRADVIGAIARHDARAGGEDKMNGVVHRSGEFKTECFPPNQPKEVA